MTYPTLLVLFFLPFLTVKCSTGQKVLELNGFQMAKGGNYDNKFSKMLDLYQNVWGEKKDRETKDSFEGKETMARTQAELRKISSIDPNPALIVFLITTIAILVLSFLKQFQNLKLIHLLIFTIVQLLSLITYFVLVQYYSDIDTVNKLTQAYSTLIDIGVGFGFYFCMAIVFALFVFQLRLLSEQYAAKSEPDIDENIEEIKPTY
jgi:hypothetical protein